jgi:hypothetical protein
MSAHTSYLVQILEHVKSPTADELGEECPYCMVSYQEPPVSDQHSRGSCACGKSMSRLRCKHLVHTGCYIAAMKVNAACPQCGVIPQAEKSEYDRKIEQNKQQAVPSIIPKLLIKTLSNGTKTIQNVRSDTRMSEIVAVAQSMLPTWRIRLLVMGEMVDETKTLADYPGVHISGVHVQQRL